MLIEIGPLPTGDCDHRREARGHDPGVMLRHLTEVRQRDVYRAGLPAACGADVISSITFRTRPAVERACAMADPKCRSDHRMKQDPRWNAEQLPGGYIRWTTPSGRQYVTEPTRYPV